MSLRDLDVALELRWGFESARAGQAFDDMATVVLQALGGSKSSPPPRTAPPRPAEPKPGDFPQTEDDLRRRFASFFGPGAT